MFVKDLGTDPGIVFDVVLARRLAHEIDHPSTSMSVAPIVTQLRDLMEKLDKKRTGAATTNAFAGLQFGAR
ncbi:hypothetical protein [Curtobacterium oceanosedimentum]|uniref:hypothetical protein n=1 Tax=Curtobacterium oceanosedimentum TaxID=465820 RepID=UPI00339819CA